MMEEVMSDLYDKVEKALQRNERKAERYSNQYEGKEEQHIFHDGWNLGYWEGRVSALEEILDMLEDEDMKPQIDYNDLEV
jgi:phage protein U